MSPTSERRRKERFSLEVPVIVSMIDEIGREKSIEFMTRDISSGGAFFFTDYCLEKGEDLKMSILLRFMKNRKKRTLIDISGKITRTEGSGVAVRFNDRYNISSF